MNYLFMLQNIFSIANHCKIHSELDFLHGDCTSIDLRDYNVMTKELGKN